MQSGLSKLADFVLCANALGQTLGEKWEILWRQTKNIRVRVGLARYHPDSIYELSTRYGTLFLRDNFGDITNLPDLFYRNVYRCRRLRADGVILDIGANIGLFSAWAAFHNPGRKIYCFEPLASNARLIPLNCPTASVLRKGLGRQPARLKLRVDPHGVMASSISTPWPTHEQEVEVVPLDEWAQEHGIEQIAFMKLDAEGMEIEILAGARETLCHTRHVAMETHSPELHRQCVQLLRHAGFVLEAEEFVHNTGLLFATRPGPARGEWP